MLNPELVKARGASRHTMARWSEVGFSSQAPGRKAKQTWLQNEDTLPVLVHTFASVRDKHSHHAPWRTTSFRAYCWTEPTAPAPAHPSASDEHNSTPRESRVEETT